MAGDRVIPRSFPLAAVDRLSELHPDARVLAEYHWGGYVIYPLFGASTRVLVDGRTDMYDKRPGGLRLDQECRARLGDLLALYGADAILVPPETVLVSGAARDAGCCEVHPDEVAVLLPERCSN